MIALYKIHKCLIRIRITFTLNTYKIKTSFISPESYNTVSCFLGNLQIKYISILEIKKANKGQPPKKKRVNLGTLSIFRESEDCLKSMKQYCNSQGV